MTKPKTTAMATSKETLSTTVREMIKEQLRSEFKIAESLIAEMGDEELIKALSTAAKDAKNEAREAQEKVISAKVDYLQDKLNTYRAACGENVPSKVLLERLFHLNVSPRYVHLFRDQDNNLSDAEIWQVVRDSNVKPFKNINEVLRR